MQKIRDLDDALDQDRDQNPPKSPAKGQKATDFERAIADTKQKINAAFGRTEKMHVKTKLTLSA